MTLLRRALLSAVLVGAAACSDLPTPPAADLSAPAAPAVTANGWHELRLVIDKCDAPDVVITGDVHEVFRVHLDENGGLHRGYHLNFRLTGLGEDGLAYAYSGVQSSQIYFANPPFTDVTELRLRMIAQGSHDDFVQIFKYHQTIDANGEITSFIEAASEECGEGQSGGTPSP